MGVTRFTEGGVTVELSGEFEAFALAAVDHALPGIRKKMEREVVPLLEDAREQWPVKSGVSRAGLKIVTEIGPHHVRVMLVNDVVYAKYVRPSEWYGADTAWNRLIKKPMTELRKRLEIELGPEVVEALREAA